MSQPTPPKGSLPGQRGIQHFGLTVPDLEEAVSFFCEVLGCEPFFELGTFAFDDDWMHEHLNVHPRAVIRTFQMLRCGNGTNLEVFEYSAPDQADTPPKNSDIGGHHLAFYVDDMDAAVAFLRERDIRVLGEPSTFTEGPGKGLRPAAGAGQFSRRHGLRTGPQSPALGPAPPGALNGGDQPSACRSRALMLARANNPTRNN